MLFYCKHVTDAGTSREELFATKPLKKAEKQRGGKHFKLAQGKHFNMNRPQVQTQRSAEVLQRCDKHRLFKIPDTKREVSKNLVKAGSTSQLLKK